MTLTIRNIPALAGIIGLIVKVGAIQLMRSKFLGPLSKVIRLLSLSEIKVELEALEVLKQASKTRSRLALKWRNAKCSLFITKLLPVIGIMAIVPRIFMMTVS